MKGDGEMDEHCESECEKADGAAATESASVDQKPNDGRIETRNIFRMSNICIFIYILLNIFLIWSILSWFSYTGESLGRSLILYLISLVIALSPIGEFVLRLQTGCKKIKREDQKQIIMPIFEEVYARAKAITPSIPSGIKLYMCNENSPNAFATGRKTICVTRGLLQLPPEQIKAILAHEFGHIAHRDTYVLQAVVVGNFIVTILVTALRIAAFICTGIAHAVASSGNGVGNLIGVVFSVLAHIAVFIGFNVFMWLWTKLGVLLCMKTSRDNEFEADRYSSNCGYNKELTAAFERLAGCSEPTRGIFAMLSSSHPDFDDRIAKLQCHAVKE